MKKIEAIIRKSKFRMVKDALVKSGIENFSYWLVRNVGEATESRVYRGVQYKTSAVERIHLSLVVKGDGNEIIKLITDAGLTGGAGDGRIFITDLSGVYRIITRDDSDVVESLNK